MLLKAVPQIMGIINLSPDSFYSGSISLSEIDFEKRFALMIEQGADIIDIGACSTRPGSTPVSEDEEWELLKPALKKVLRVFPSSVISIDTFRSSIVERAFDFVGDFIINDISAGEDDRNMLKMAAKLQLPYIAMHKKGTPQNMQQMCDYSNVVEDVRDYFKNFIRKATDIGLYEIAIDPGFGFAKTPDQNYRLLNSLQSFSFSSQSGIHYPIVVGISRKSMIYRTLETTPEQCLPATSALHLYALLNGVHIIRAHDVKEAREVLTIYDAITRNK